MGYSCSVRANLTYDAIQLMSEFDSLSDNLKYFCEIGRENRDGSMTGQVYEMTECRKFCKKKGSFKIGAGGNIIRFPGLEKYLWAIPMVAAIEEYDRRYAPKYLFTTKQDQNVFN